MTALDTANLTKIQEYARLNDEAAAKARAEGQKRLANKLTKTANEWRRVAGELLTSRNVILN